MFRGRGRNPRRLLDLFQHDRTRLRNEPASVLRLHEAFRHHPILSSNRAADLIRASAPTVNNGFKKLEALGIVRELTGGGYGRLHGYTAYLDILNEGGEPL
jgi:Fic family protein